jgi:hypothetical protein
MRGVELETVGDGERGMNARKTTRSKPLGDGDGAPNAADPDSWTPPAAIALKVRNSF